MIGNLQLLRGLAALAVVFYHTNYQLSGGVHTDFQGVAVFFVISGFIMTLISRKNSDFFMIRRIVRIVPIYWFATLAFFFIEICAFSGSHAVAWWNYQDNSKDLLKSLFFVPYLNGAGDMHPLLPVGWTLNLEMFYYVLFYVALKINVKYAPALTLVVLVALWLSAPTNALLAFYSGSYTLYFCFGIVAYYLWVYLGDRLPLTWKAPLGIFAAAYAVFYIAFHVYPDLNGYFSQSAGGRVLAWLLPAGLILMALLLHSALLRLTSRPLTLLGDASYSLYLVHLIVLQQLSAWFAGIPALDFKASLFGAMVACAVAVLVAVAMFYFLERPVTRILAKALRPQKNLADSRAAWRSKVRPAAGGLLGD